MEQKVYAVLTGDIVDSTNLGESTELALNEIKAILGELTRWRDKGEVIETSQIFRGDSFQIIFSRPSRAIEAALFIRARLLANRIKVDVRQAVGFGSIDNLKRGAIEESNGEAFRISGKTLDGMRKHQRVAFAARGVHRESIYVIGRLVDALVVRWTSAQAKTISLLSPHKTQAEIAKEQGTSQPAVGKNLSLAGVNAIKAAMDAVDVMFDEEEKVK